MAVRLAELAFEFEVAQTRTHAQTIKSLIQLSLKRTYIGKVKDIYSKADVPPLKQTQPVNLTKFFNSTKRGLKTIPSFISNNCQLKLKGV
jgi:hypothetical protein